MKKTVFLFLILFATAVMAKPKHIVVAYVTIWTNEIPDPTQMTHINYAFGCVNETFNGVTVQKPERLKQLAELKKQNPKLHLLLSIGGWGTGRFNEMAADEQLRLAFAKDCKRVIEEYNLDGIDIDWEYPTQSGAGISASPDDTKNYTLMMRDIRKAIGKKKDLTLASCGSARYIPFPDILPYLDFVNIMAYDLGSGEKHHSALYPCSISGNYTADKAVKAHLDAGLPLNKLVLGMPFYSRGIGHEWIASNQFQSVKEKEGLEEFWDTEGCVPYMKNKEGKIVMTYDNPLSISIKCKYIKKKGLLGGMYWHYGYDDEQHTLSRVVAHELLEKEKTE